MPRVLFFDIETAPNLAYVWGHYDQNVIAHEREWYVLCVSYKWEGSPAKTVGLTDFPENYAKDPEDDSMVVAEVHRLLDEADIVIAHNGDKFDIRKCNARFVAHDMAPPSPYHTVDTLKVARKYFMFNSNKLGDLGAHLGLGAKVSTGGFELWKGCMQGKPEAWKKMLKYAKQDTVLLEKVYLALRPWMTNHPNRNNYGEDVDGCPSCGGTNLARSGTRTTQTMRYQRYRCTDCSSYCRGRLAIADSPKPDVVP